MMSRRQSKKFGILVLIAFSFIFCACGREDLSTLKPQGPIAQEQYDLMKLSMLIMMGVLVVVFAIFTYVIIKFRKRRGDRSVPEQVKGSIKLELIWTIIPLFLIGILAVPTVKTTFVSSKDFSKDPNAVQVRVTAHLYWWEFDYPQHGVNTASDLVIPVGKNIAFELKTADVLHSFWVPSLAGKMDTNPLGMINKFSFSAPKQGVYLGKCAELCGASHAFMEFKVKVISEKSFHKWIQAMKKKAVLPKSKQLAETFKKNCLSCHAVGDQGAKSGPNLTGIGSRETVASILINEKVPHTTQNDVASVQKNMKTWMNNPEAIKPNNSMPNPKHLGLSQQQIDQICNYLANYTLDH